MPRTAPWHCVKSGVYHNNSRCSTGPKIEDDKRREGTGGKPLCQECADLNRRGQ